MTKIAILCDTHFGIKADSPVFLDHQETFFKETFFPYLKSNNIKTIFHLGDTFDRRKQINFLTLHRSKKFFFNHLSEYDYHMVTGNHDVFYTNTNEINSVRLLLNEYPNLNLYETEPKELKYDSVKFLLSPWITKTNEELSYNALARTSATAIMGHFEIIGFELMKGILATHGLDKKLFSKFESVYSGHFHHPSEYENIKYLGAQYEMNWSDYAGKRGFHVYDTENKSLKFIKNPVSLHHKITYDDSELSIDDLSVMDFSEYRNKFVKVIVKNRTNPFLFDSFMEKLAESNPFDLKSIEENLIFEEIGSEEEITEVKDTRFVLHEYIDSIETNIPKERIKAEIDNIYMEALNIL